MKKLYFLTLLLVLGIKPLYAQDGFMGEIKLFAGDFTPRGWALCNGQLLPINQNQALFSLLGTTYGGNGTTTFGLPDLRGRIPVGVGTNKTLGQQYSAETVSLTTSNLPAHSHNFPIKVSSAAGTLNVPAAPSSIASAVESINSKTYPVLGYNTSTPNVVLSGTATTTTGSSTPINIMQPYTVTTYIICVQGIYPSRN